VGWREIWCEGDRGIGWVLPTFTAGWVRDEVEEKRVDAGEDL